MRPRSILLPTTLALATAGAIALAWPMASPATLTEVGVIPKTTPATVPSCPATPCEAVSRTTGYQVEVGTQGSVVSVPRNGMIVAWTIALSKPNSTEIKYLDTHEGGPPSAGIAILEPQSTPTAKTSQQKTPTTKTPTTKTPKPKTPKPKTPSYTYKLVAQSPVMKLEPYFGRSAQFPLETALKVKKGDVIGLTVPTWAPALALGFPSTTSWRASRSQAQCKTMNLQTALSTNGETVQFYCLYTTARLTYSATLVSTP
jgi:hypothetical protein